MNNIKLQLCYNPKFLESELLNMIIVVRNTKRINLLKQNFLNFL